MWLVAIRCGRATATTSMMVLIKAHLAPFTGQPAERSGVLALMVMRSEDGQCVLIARCRHYHLREQLLTAAMYLRTP